MNPSYNNVIFHNEQRQQQLKTTYQLRDVGHLSHVVQSLLCGFTQHDVAGGHDAQVPQRLHVRRNVTVAIWGKFATYVW